MENILVTVGPASLTWSRHSYKHVCNQGVQRSLLEPPNHKMLCHYQTNCLATCAADSLALDGATLLTPHLLIQGVVGFMKNLSENHIQQLQ